MKFHQNAFISFLCLAEHTRLGVFADNPGVLHKGQDVKRQDVPVHRRLKPDTKSRKKSTELDVSYDEGISSNKGKSSKVSPQLEVTLAMTTKALSAKSLKALSETVAASMSYDTFVPLPSQFDAPTLFPTMVTSEVGIKPDSVLIAVDRVTGDRLTPSPTDENATFRRGDLKNNVRRLGIKVSRGMSVRVVATANKRVKLSNGQRSSLPFHGMPDGAAVFSLSDGGYVYVSNSEMDSSRGGVYAVYFNNRGDVVDYKMLLSNTTRNCAGGKTPFNSWVSCEEYARGQCWQVDPQGRRRSEMTVLGGEGGNYEAVACDDRNPLQPIFYVTEDVKFGALRKFTPVEGPANWDTLNGPGTTEYLVFLDDKTFTWSLCDDAARTSQSIHYPNVEGIDFKDGILYFVSKKKLMLYALDLDNNTYTMSSTNGALLGGGEFTNSPDQLIRNEGGFLYFTEDGGKTPGVYAVGIDSSGQRFAVFEAYGKQYIGDETTGLAFSPDGTKMYACFQDCGCEVSGEGDCGCMLEYWRNDGRSFDGATMNLKYHSSE
ncbi:hypothetical protein ACHAXS_009935 [Conticribra weissflogii]